MILLIDHHDSFVYNLARYVRELGKMVKVVCQDAVTVEAVEAIQPSHIILSPGPCKPEDVPVSLAIIQHFQSKIPILGVCLGHQMIGQCFGGKVVRAKRPLHGQASTLSHIGKGLFQDIPNPVQVGRYHSLIVEKAQLCDTFAITAYSEEGEIMAFESKTKQLFGVQFHPESILTAHGHTLLANFLNGVTA